MNTRYWMLCAMFWLFALGGNSCEKVLNLTGKIMDHVVTLSWESPVLGKASLDKDFLFDNGTIVTSSGNGPSGANLSMINTGGAIYGFNADKLSKYPSWVADDFELLNETLLESISFYLYQLNEVPATKIVNAVYLRLRKGEDPENSVVVWGNETNNCFQSCAFDNCYRVFQADINSKRPVSKIVAKVNVTLAPGKYWLEVAFNSPGESLVYAVPVVNKQGNGWQRRGSSWLPMSDNESMESAALAFVLNGKTTENVVGFNVYRNGSKLNDELISSYEFKDKLTTSGEYAYEVSAFYADGCESEKESIIFKFDQNTSTLLTPPWIDGFESVDFSTGYNQITESNDLYWKIHTTGSRNYPETASEGRKFAYYSNESVTGSKARLILPAMSLADYQQVKLSFERYHKAWSQGKDELRVLYKTSPEEDWTQLTSYNNDQGTWRKEIISLPSENYYQVAFEAISNYGYGVCLDNLSITSSPGIPENAIAVTVPDGVTTLSWKAPESDGGNPIQGYIITPYKENQLQPQVNVGLTESYVFENLEQGVRYSFQVSAQNANGVGKMSPMSNEIIAGVTGLNEIADLNLRIYPNPVKDNLYIDCDEEVISVSIYNLYGVKVLFIHNPSGNISLNMLSRGMYIVETEVKQTKNKQIIIKL